MPDEFNFFQNKDIIKAFQEFKPYILDIERLIQQVKYGKIVFAVRVHNGCVTDFVVQSSTRKRYDLKKGGVEGEETKTTPFIP